MRATNQAKYKVQAQFSMAIALDPRLFILDELSRGERGVCRFTEWIN